MTQEEYNAQFAKGEFSVNSGGGGGGGGKTAPSYDTYGSQKDFNRQFRGSEFSVTNPAAIPKNPIVGNIQKFFEGLKSQPMLSKSIPFYKQQYTNPKTQLDNDPVIQNKFDFGLSNFSSLYKIKNVFDRPKPLEIQKIKDEEEEKFLMPNWLKLTTNIFDGKDNKFTIDNRARQILKQPINDIIYSIQEARRESQPSLQKFAEFYNSTEGKTARAVLNLPLVPKEKNVEETFTKKVAEATAPVTKFNKNVVEGIKDFILPTRGYTEKELSEAKPGFKETFIGGAKAVGEIANIVPIASTMLGGQLAKLGGSDEYAANIQKQYNNYLIKSGDVLAPNSAGEAKAMRMADILGLGAAGSARKLTNSLARANTAKEVEKVVSKYGLAYSEDTINKIAKTTDKKEIDTLLKETPLEKEKVLKKQLNNYQNTLEKNIKKYQKEGNEITPQIAEYINNQTAKQVPLYLDEAVMEVPTNQGTIAVYTKQKPVLQNLLKDREKINYKTVDYLGEDINGQPITAKFEWDYKKQEGSILSTEKATTAQLATELGNSFDRQTIAKINTELQQLLPNYAKNVERNNGELTAYAVKNLDGDITNKKITEKIDNLANSFHKELEALSSKDLPSQRLPDAMRKIINDPEDAAKKAPELTEFVQYNLIDSGSIANDIQRIAYESGISPIQIQKTQQKISREQLIKEQAPMMEDYNRMQEFAKQAKQTNNDVDAVGKELNPEANIKGVDEGLQSKEIETLKNEARKYKTAEEFENAAVSMYGKAMLKGSDEEKKLAKAIEGIGDFKAFHASSKEKPTVKTTSSVDKRGNTVEKSEDGNVVKITDKEGKVLYEAEDLAKESNVSKKSTSKKESTTYKKAPKGQEALYKEARKYKSADEFVNKADITKTQEFKKWAGKDKVVEVYHGSPNEFDTFKMGDETYNISGQPTSGVSFADKYSNAEPFSRQYSERYNKEYKQIFDKFKKLYDEAKKTGGNEDFSTILKKLGANSDKISSEDASVILKYRGKRELEQILTKDELNKLEELAFSDKEKLNALSKQKEQEIYKLDKKYANEGKVYRAYLKGKVVEVDGEDIGFGASRNELVDNLAPNEILKINNADTGQYIGTEYMTNNPDNIFIVNTGKTKSQLTDIWNKAQEKQVTKPKAKPTEKATGSSQKKEKAKDEQSTGKESKSSKTEDKSATKLRSRVFERLQSENPDVLKGDLKYDAIKLKEDANKAVDLINEDPQKAYRIAMGIDESKDVTSTGVNIAMAEKALDVGDDSLYARLTKNRSLAQTRRGQEISAERGSVTNNTTSRYVKELIAMRMEMLDKKHFKNVRNVMKGTTKKGVAIQKIDETVKKAQKKLSMKEMDMEAAQKLIDSLSC